MPAVWVSLFSFVDVVVRLFVCFVGVGGVVFLYWRWKPAFPRITYQYFFEMGVALAVCQPSAFSNVVYRSWPRSPVNSI